MPLGEVGASCLHYPDAMALEVGIVGLPNSGKTTLFNALTRAGAEITAYASVTDKPNVGMATIADDRLDRLATLVEAKKVTPAAVRVVDVPGTGPQLLGNLRQVDAILAVLDGFSADATPADDLETLAGLLDHLDEGLTLADWPGEVPAELDPLTT